MIIDNDIPACPECEKLAAISEKSQELGLFLDLIFSNYGTLCKWQEAKYYDEDGNLISKYIDACYSDPEGYYPTRVTIEQILADYFKIDMNLVNEERSILLKYI